jgi:hypothetical protein
MNNKPQLQNQNELLKFYNFEDLRKNELNTKTRLPTFINTYYFKYHLFRKFYRDYMSRTPESDSLYRRRNRLIILTTSGFFYYKTSKGIFNRIELEIFSTHKGFSLRKLFIPLSKSIYFLSLIFMSQIFIKYIYYLNKVFKSYQFALEGVLKYNLMEKGYIYRGDWEETGKFDILDSENIKKNQ